MTPGWKKKRKSQKVAIGSKWDAVLGGATECRQDAISNGHNVLLKGGGLKHNGN